MHGLPATNGAPRVRSREAADGTVVARHRAGASSGPHRGLVPAPARLRQARGRPASMIRLDSVSKRYPNGQLAVTGLSLDVLDGETCVLLGPSGCGKTTTLKMINRLIEPTSGRIFLDDEDVTRVDPIRLRRRIGYVIQQVGLFPHETIEANVGTVPRLLGWDRARIRARVSELLELVGLAPDQYRRRYPAQLSGGQGQRVGGGRALAADPPVLLIDCTFR